MNFAKVKMIIILCLLVVNTVLAILCVKLVSEKNYISEEEVSLAKVNLSKNGIDAEFDKDAKRLYDLPVYVVAPEDDTDYIPEIYKQITEAFFDVKTDNSAYIKTPDGYSASVKNNDGILLGNASVSEKMHIECSFDADADYKDLQEVKSIGYSDKLKSDKNGEYDIAKEFVGKALHNYGMKFNYSGSKSYGEGTVVCFNGELSGVPVPGAYLNVYVKKDKIACCVGEISVAAPEKKYSTRIVDSIDAAFMLADYIRENGSKASVENTKIRNISMTYGYVEYSYGEYYVIPTWIMEYTAENGESVIYSVDAIEGGTVRIP